MKKVLLLTVVGMTTLGLTAQEQRVPLFEVSSSSTCPPCKPGNEALKAVLDTKPEDEYVLVKYQQYFPGTGDPYHTEEGKYRFLNIYNVGQSSVAVPQLNVNGAAKENIAISSTRYNAAKAVPATYKLSGNYTVSGHDVNINIKYTPLESGTDPKLIVAILEKETEKNIKSNGESKFYHIMKKMVPDHLGTDISSTAVNTEDSKNLTYSFKGEYRLPPNGQSNLIDDATEHSVEDFDNLKVVAWIQGSDNTVYQAVNLTYGATSITQVSNTVKSVSVYPNPTQADINIKFEMLESDVVNASIVSLTGQIVKNKEVKLNKGENQITFDTQDLASGSYNIIIFDSKNNSFAQRVSVIK